MFEKFVECREWIELGMKRCVGVSELSRSESIEMGWAIGKNG